MSIKFSKLSRTSIRNLKSGQRLNEHGIIFERLENGDGRYSVNIMSEGERIHRVIGKESDGVTRFQAEQFIEQLKTEARKGRLNLPKGRKNHLSFVDAANKYIERLKEEGGKNIKTKQRQLRQHLNPFFHGKNLNQIAGFDVERYKHQRQKSGAVNGTINRELAVLSHLLNKAQDWKWVEHKPCRFKRLKEEQTRIVYLTTEQVKRLLDVSMKDENEEIYLFIVIGLQTAMRRSEILSIELKNIDLDRKVIYIPNSKTGPREQPITQELAKLLKPYIDHGRPDAKWLFPSGSSKTGHTVNIEKPFRRVVLKAGLNPKEIVRHTLRHTAITHLVQAGVDLPTVKRISGHKTLAMVERYSHQNGEHIQSAMDILQDRYRLNLKKKTG